MADGCGSECEPRERGDAGSDLRRRFNDEVPECTGNCDVFRPQRDAHTLLGVVFAMHGVANPPGAVSVGRLGDPSRGLGCSSKCCG